MTVRVTLANTPTRTFNYSGIRRVVAYVTGGRQEFVLHSAAGDDAVLAPKDGYGRIELALDEDCGTFC